MRNSITIKKYQEMNYAELSKKVEEHVISYFNSRENPQLTYHNLDHTLSVVKAAKQIADDYQLSDKELFIVTAAAWFHDIGYLKGAEKHEEKGAKMAHVFLHKSGVNSESIQTITECILATTLPQNPKTTLEEIVCDADLSHLGSDDFWEKSKLLRKEMENREARFISKDEWRKSTTDFLINHHYFTNYGESVLAKKKKENLEKLQQKEVKKNKKSDENKTGEPEKSVNPKKKEERSSRSNRGVETMFRISSSNNQRLSDMADNKAHILISVNSIILSAIISLVLHKLDEYRYLAWPTYLILSVSVFTIIYSILATRPTISKGTFSKDEVEEKKVNLLFFGNYYKMSLDDYSHSMQQVMSDTVFTYKTLVQDVYFQGIVLGRKYKLLRKGYNIFMFGLIASVIAFVVASMLEGR
jgi:predicted metal-dependent HD superfamily phosphohydrolase